MYALHSLMQCKGSFPQPASVIPETHLKLSGVDGLAGQVQVRALAQGRPAAVQLVSSSAVDYSDTGAFSEVRRVDPAFDRLAPRDAELQQQALVGGRVGTQPLFFAADRS